MTPPTASDRLPCCVPFCRRTRGLEKRDHGRLPSEWVCAAHWRAVPAAQRAEYLKLRRLSRRAWEAGKSLPRLFCRTGDAWEACKSVAIERAMGVG